MCPLRPCLSHLGTNQRHCQVPRPLVWKRDNRILIFASAVRSSTELKSPYTDDAFRHAPGADRLTASICFSTLRTTIECSTLVDTRPLRAPSKLPHEAAERHLTSQALGLDFLVSPITSLTGHHKTLDSQGGPRSLHSPTETPLSFAIKGCKGPASGRIPIYMHSVSLPASSSFGRLSRQRGPSANILPT